MVLTHERVHAELNRADPLGTCSAGHARPPAQHQSPGPLVPGRRVGAIERPGVAGRRRPRRQRRAERRQRSPGPGRAPAPGPAGPGLPAHQAGAGAEQGPGGRLPGPALPADRPARRPLDRRLRGPDPLAAPGPRPAAAGVVHPPGGGDRADRPDRPLGAGGGVLGGRRAGGRPERGHAVRHRQPLPPAARRRPAGGTAPPDPGVLRRAPRAAGAGDHRERPDGGPGDRPGRPGADRRTRRAALPGRLRNRLLQLELPEPLPHRRRQARPLLRGRHAHRPGEPQDRAHGERAGRRARPAHRGRRDRAGGAGGRPDRHRLRERPGLPVRRAAGRDEPEALPDSCWTRCGRWRPFLPAPSAPRSADLGGWMGIGGAISRAAPAPPWSSPRPRS